MKKKLLSVLICIMMCISLVPMSALADGGQTIEVQTPDAFIAALNQQNPVAAINITQSFTVSADCTVSFDAEHLSNYCDAVVTIADGVTVTVENGGVIGCAWFTYQGDWSNPPLPNGKLINNGTVIVKNGGIIGGDFNRNNGTVIVENGGEAVCCNDNYGTITVQSGGCYQTTQGSNSNNHGQIDIQPGARMQSRFGCTIVNCSDGTMKIDGTFLCGCIRFEDQEGLWFKNDGSVSGSGDIVIYQANPEDGLANMDAMIEIAMGEIGQESRFTNWDDISIFKKVSAGTYDELVAILIGNRTVAGEAVEGAMDVIVDVTDNITIPENTSIMTMGQIKIPTDVSVTVQNGATLEAGIENSGTISVESSGKLFTTMGTNIINNGVITVKEGAEPKSQKGRSVVNNQGATLTVDGDFYCGCLHFENTEGAWFENTGTVNGNGKIFLYQVDSEPIVDMMALIESVRVSIGQPADNKPVVCSASHIYQENWKNNSKQHWHECSGCGSKKDIANHTYDNDCDKTCNVCGYTRTVTHKYVDKITPATLTKNGKIVPTCSRCKATKTATVIYYPKTVKLSATTYTYNGKVKTPTVTVKDSKGKTVSASNYTVTYSGNKDVGTAKVTVKFKGNYSGTKTLSFTITPKQVTGLKVSGEKTTSLKLTWSKVTGAKYYKVEQSTDGKTWKAVKTTSSTSLTVSKLTAGKKYQFRVTALDSTKKIAGKASSVLKTGTLTSAPSLTLKSTKSKTATASWKKVTGASKYVVYKSTNGNKWTKVTTTTKTSYNLTKLTGGKKIYVRVTALNAYSKTSAYSSTKNVTVKK